MLNYHCLFAVSQKSCSNLNYQILQWTFFNLSSFAVEHSVTCNAVKIQTVKYSGMSTGSERSFVPYKYTTHHTTQTTVGTCIHIWPSYSTSNWPVWHQDPTRAKLLSQHDEFQTRGFTFFSFFAQAWNDSAEPEVTAFNGDHANLIKIVCLFSVSICEATELSQIRHQLPLLTPGAKW